MNIELMSVADLPRVRDLAEQLGYPNALADVEKRFRTMDGSPDYALLVAKDEAGRVIAYLQVNVEAKTLLADARADVAALVVDENERGRGVGSALLAKAEAWARERGVPYIRVRSNAKRTDAHRFYERHGYETGKTSLNFGKWLRE